MNRLQSDADSTHSNQSSQAQHVYEDKVQNELVEIMNDFKNNIHSITEVEQLVDKWRLRNNLPNYQKNKSEELNRMRQEYERLQQKMKDEMKRPTPFERFKKLFSRNKSICQEDLKCNKETVFPTEEKIMNFSANNLRPISSLSLQSTASKYRI